MKLAGLFAGLMLLSSTSYAAPTEQQEADRLFKLGRQALDLRKFAEARDRFEASLKLYPGTGVKLNLGTCYVALDELEKAEAMFRAAETEAKAKDESTRLGLAREGLGDVEKHKAVLFFKFTPALPAEAEVLFDNVPLARARLLSTLPVVKGRHALRVKVPGEAALDRAVDVPKNGVAQTVDIALPGAWVAAVPGASDGTTGNGQRTAGYVLGGVGAAALLGTGVGLFAFGSGRKWELNEETRPVVNTYTYLGIASAAVLATGAVLVLTAPKSDSPSAALHVAPTQGGISAVFTGRF